MADPGWAAVRLSSFRRQLPTRQRQLLDLSHESFVHEETIGNESVAESPAS